MDKAFTVQIIKNDLFSGELFLPHKADTGLAAVVIMNSSAGVCDIRERFYARFLAEAGIAALAVDSFSPRGIVETIRDQSQIADQTMEADAYAAFDCLVGDPRFDATRIAVMGVSKGGQTTINTALLARRAWFRRPAQDFAARIALVPPAHMQQRDARTDGRPMLMLLAEKDDYTGVSPALAYADRMRRSGNNAIKTVIYPNAHHAWECTGPPIWLAEAEKYSHCLFFVEDNAELTEETSGRRMTVQEFLRNRERYRALGAHVGGGTANLKKEAASAIVQFLQEDVGWRLP